MNMLSPRIGIVAFADSRNDISNASAANQYIQEQHLTVARQLATRGFQVLDPQSDEARTTGVFAPITSFEDGSKIARQLLMADVEAIVIGAWRWSEPMPVVDLVRRLNVPTALYTHATADFSGYGGITAYGAALWEVSPNRAALVHARITDDMDELANWAQGACAYSKLRRARLLIWGSASCRGMEHLPDDTVRLKAWLIGDIMQEGQYYLIKRAEAFLQERNEIRAFLDWLQSNGTHLILDDKMLTSDSLARSVALYLAAEQHIAELGGASIAGVSVQCHKELSTEYGVTGCLIPAFVPFPENHRGAKRAIPTTCEGDLKSLITSILLNFISPKTPIHFGDLRELNDEPNLVVISNCGASSVYYAGNSNTPREVLPHLTVQKQIFGVSGASVTLKGRALPEVTVARLCRVNGQYWMHVGIGKTIDVSNSMMNNRKWAREWPTVAIDFGIPTKDFARVAASNHYCLIPGNHLASLKVACAQAGIRVLRIDRTSEIENAIESMTQTIPPWETGYVS